MTEKKRAIEELRKKIAEVSTNFPNEISLEWVLAVSDGKDGINQELSEAMFRLSVTESMGASGGSPTPGRSSSRGVRPPANTGAKGNPTQATFLLGVNQKIVDNKISYLSAGFGEAKKLPEELHDAVLIEIKPRSVVFLVITPEIRQLAEKSRSEAAAEPDEAKRNSYLADIDKVVDAGNRIKIEIQIDKTSTPEPAFGPTDNVDDIVNKIVKASTEGDNKGSTPKPSTTNLSPQEKAIIEKAAADKAKKDAERAKIEAEIPKESFERDGALNLGQDLLDPAMYNGLEDQVETYIDPETKKPAGVRIGGNYSPSESSALRKYGAQPGDVIKSINGVAVTTSESIRATVRKMR
ncbi:MAG: hypothetical protein KDB07_10480, partial [Planctomycetes bacterium]|nr:hypothetical protein [Planctomycetota bacterium]